MKVSPRISTHPEGQMDHPTSSSLIIMGRQDYLSVVLRLVGMELYKLRRRGMSKVIGSIAVVFALLPFLLVAFGTYVTANGPVENFTPACQAQNAPNAPGSLPPQGGPSSNCPTPSPAQAASLRQLAVQGTSAPLRLPTSLNIAVQFALIAGTILLIILVGTFAGGEYSTGTIRLLFIRGPTRTQFLLGKLAASLLIICAGMLLMAILGVLAGQAFNPLSGFAQSGDFWSAGWLGHALLYLLIAMLNWFMYATIAIFFATLGRSTVAGVVGGITWFFVEPILASLLGLIANFSHGPLGDFLRAIPDYFIGNNFSALLDDQGQYLFGGSSVSAPSLPAIHALLVLLVYFAFFIGLAGWLNKRRDVTN
ncbi:MAG: hypothetical protein NVS3B14_11660 [Ktedonobacteraceae bacterium]